MDKLIKYLLFFLVSFVAIEGFSHEESQINSMAFVSYDADVSPKDGEIEIIDVFVPNEEKFYSLMTRYIGYEITLENLNCIKQAVRDYYTKNGYPFVLVNLLEQDASFGLIKFQVVVSKIAKVCVEGSRYFSQKRVEKSLNLASNDLVSTDKIIKDLYWINQNPFRRAGAVFKPGEEPFTTDVDISINDTRPFRVFGEYQNTGNLIAGDTRFTAGFNWGNVFNLDHQLNFQFITSTTTKHWWAISANYIVPLPF